MSNIFRMEDSNISMIRGDTLSFGIELINENNEPFTQDLDSAFFSCKNNKTDNEFVFIKGLNKGITKAENGKYIVRVAPMDTQNIEAGKYFYDFQIGINDDIFTILHGVLEIEQDVTFGDDNTIPFNPDNYEEYKEITNSEIDDMF